MNRTSVSVKILVSLGLVTACTGPDETEGTETAALTSAELSLRGGKPAGARLFLEEVPGVGGNGRACATCHVAADGFQLTPEHVESRWQELQERRCRNPDADDPLFRPIDADDFAQDFTTLRSHALVRVTIEMAPNVRVLDDPAARSVSLWRSTPTVFNVALTAPYQLDGRVPTLPLQALGALHGHAQIATEPPAKLLDTIAAFEQTLFPDAYALAVAEAVRTGKPVPPEPAVTGAAAAGKVVFDRECSFCHSGPALNKQKIPGLFLGDVLVSRPLPPFADPGQFDVAPALPVRTWAITLPDGSEVVRPSTDPGKALITGDPKDFNNFEISQLRGLARIAPYFHDNSAKTLRDVATHYQAVFAALRAAGLVTAFLDDDELDPLVAYLETL